ncbi:pyridoxal phosphate-dependent aminotransferase [Parathalassolituus penaei]|uniref:Aminotransferase n=1 Tax=Parathalassolituus penaei TaxID=2997323 RepID=A0A9X3EBA3_9GAMM|nr:pyridoxal phosphate-dependent aminotransferase [Parathalassolituus penaei]MCY0964379.1 pyridoxal phosphate-dependent aminotransferase [Parathalassolituus penaei]
MNPVAPKQNECTERAHDIQPFHVMALLAEARRLQEAGRDIIHLAVGEPDFPTPEPMVEAAVKALRAGQTGYTPALGMTALREKIAAYYQQRFGVTIPAGRILVTPGASGALLLLAASRIEVGQTLMLADPGYPCNRQFARVFEGRGQLIPSGPETAFQLTPQMVREHWNANTRAALVASPANPTGTVLSPQQLVDLAAAVREQQGELWVDEIYQGLNFTGEAHTVLSVVDDAAVINSFSKYFGMTGWRLGWTVVPECWVERMDVLAQNLFLAPPTPAQHAAMVAFEPDTLAILEQRREILRARRQWLLKALPELGFGIPVEPDGAFYIYADASRFTDNSLEFCRRCLQEAGVAITPGVDFGVFEANTHIRIAYSAELPRLQEAVDRLAAWLPK